jgi:hypothetical protein
MHKTTLRVINAQSCISFRDIQPSVAPDCPRYLGKATRWSGATARPEPRIPGSAFRQLNGIARRSLVRHLAMFAAIRRASSWVSNLTPARFDRAHSR